MSPCASTPQPPPSKEPTEPAPPAAAAANLRRLPIDGHGVGVGVCIAAPLAQPMLAVAPSSMVAGATTAG